MFLCVAITGARLQGDATRDTRIAARFGAGTQLEVDEATNISSGVGGLGSTTPTSELATVTEESQSWSRQDQQERVEYNETCASPLNRMGPKSPKQRRPARRAGSAGMRLRLPCSGTAHTEAWHTNGAPHRDSQRLDHLHLPQRSCMPKLVDTLEGLGGVDTDPEMEDVGTGREGRGGGGGGQKSVFRRRQPLKDEFRQMVHDNKTRSEALRRSVEAIESLAGALDSNNAEKQLLVKVFMSCAQQGARTPREGHSGATRVMMVGAGGGKRSQVAFLGQMLSVSFEERAVFESMPGPLLDALEDALRLKMSYAEAVARVAELDDELLEWQRWYAKQSASNPAGSNDHNVSVSRDKMHPVPKLNLAHSGGGREVLPRDRAATNSPRAGEAGDGPVAAAHLRSQMSQVRVENERLRMQLHEVQMHVMGKSPRGLGLDDGSQLVLDLMHKDLAAAKAQNYNLQAEVASLAEHSRRMTQDSERQKGLLYDQMNLLQIDLDKCKRELDLAKQRAQAKREAACKRPMDEQRPEEEQHALPPLDLAQVKKLQMQQQQSQQQHPEHLSAPARSDAALLQSSNENDEQRRQQQQEDNMDLMWMPAVLAQLEGSEEEAEVQLDMLPARAGKHLHAEGDMRLCAFEALSLRAERGDEESGDEDLYPLGALVSVLTALKEELAANYSHLRNAVRDEAGKEPLERSLIQELRLLQLVVASFDAQLHVLHTPQGALALTARREARVLADAAGAGGEAGDEAGRIMLLVRELEKVCVAAELRRTRRADTLEEQQHTAMHNLQQLSALPDISHDNLADGANSADESLVFSLNGTAFDPDLQHSHSSYSTSGAAAVRVSVAAQIHDTVETTQVVLTGGVVAEEGMERAAMTWLGMFGHISGNDDDAHGGSGVHEADDGELAAGFIWLDLCPFAANSSERERGEGVLSTGEATMAQESEAVPTQQHAAAWESPLLHTQCVATASEPAQVEHAASISRGAPSFKAKKPPALPLEHIKALPRDTSLEQQQLDAALQQLDAVLHADGVLQHDGVLQQDAMLQNDAVSQLSVSGEEDALALSTTAETCTDTPGEPNASFCKPSEEDARQPHDADVEHALDALSACAPAAPSESAPASDLNPTPEAALQSGGAPRGVPSLAVHIAVSGQAQAAARAESMARSINQRPMSASAVPAYMTRDGSRGADDTQQHTMPRPANSRQRPQSATLRAAAHELDLAGIGSVQRRSSHSSALQSVVEADSSSALSPLVDSSLTEVSGLGSEPSGLAGAPQHSSVCDISDGSAGSDEDVLAHADEAEEAEEEQEDKSSASRSNPEAPVVSVDVDTQHGDTQDHNAAQGHTTAVPAHTALGAHCVEQDASGEAVATRLKGDEDERLEDLERRLRVEVDNTVQMEMVQQYNQFEKGGSTLAGVAEDEQEHDQDYEHEEGALAEIKRPLSATSLASESFASPSLSSPLSDGKHLGGAGGVDGEGIDGEHDMPREMSWERREIEITPRGEHDLRVVRGDKPTRPDDRRARRTGRSPVE